MNFGIEDVWEMGKNFSKYDGAQGVDGNFSISPKRMRDMMEMTSLNALGQKISKKEFPEKYMGSYEKLGN